VRFLQPPAFAFEDTLEELGSVCFQLRALAFRVVKHEVLECYQNPFKSGFGALFRIYSNPVNPVRDSLMTARWTLASDPNYCVETPAPHLTHTIVDSPHARFVGIATVGSFVD